MYSMHDDHYFPRSYGPRDGRGDGFAPRYPMQDEQRDSFPPKYTAEDDRRNSYPPKYTAREDRRDSYPPKYTAEDDRRDSYLPKFAAEDDRRGGFGIKQPVPDDDRDRLPSRENGRGYHFSQMGFMPNGRGDDYPSNYSMQNERGGSYVSNYITQHDRGDGFPPGSRGLAPLMDESPGPTGGWGSSITSYIGSWMGREANPPGGKSRAENGFSPGNVRESQRMQGSPAYYNGHDSEYSSRSYSLPSATYGSRDIKEKGDNALTLYEPHQVALYDPQLTAARKEVKELEAALADREARIQSLEKGLNGKKKFIIEMENDFKEVRKSLFVMEGRVKDLEANEGALHVNMKDKEQELRGLFQRLEKMQSDCAAKDGKIKELQSSLQDAKRENQQLKAWRVEHEQQREAQAVAMDQLNSKVLELTTANGQLESKKQQMMKQVKEQTQRIQDLSQQASKQEQLVAAKELEAQGLQNQLRGEQEKTLKLSEEVEEKISQMDELIVYVEQLEQELAALQERVRSTESDEHEQLKLHCSTLEEKIESHEVEMQNLRARLREEWETKSKLNDRLRQADIQLEELKQHIGDPKSRDSGMSVRSLPTEHFGRDSSLGTQATPHLLEKTLQRVHEIAGIFSRLLMKAMEQGKIDGMAVARNNFVRSVSLGKAAPLKYVLEAITCKLLFQGFENECFYLEESSSAFMDLEKQRAENYRHYQQLSVMENTEQYVHSGDTLFTLFCRMKLEDLSDTIPEIASMVKEMVDHAFENSFSSEDTSTEVTTYLAAKLGTTFVQLAVCVWQVHKLAFSFNPVARIFRVAQSEKFVEKYMESVIFQESESDDDEDMPSSDISRVDFMVVPGFLINQAVVRSRVFVVTKPLSTSVRLPSRAS
ncbi:uncharacterized protein [Physcomitrium patens]|uniref:GIL1/IRKI C-terminal domain-containing protein n=1 Tax=Physcomitrium patens TaxID=3218 RepID=A0A2K1KKX8_PHYPA|nr:myosin-11-like [Physcomitrium patens]XP_024376007.1 myosin-11-like [Physcomitrium patens]XP_024376008.1 myosin-11-like [Physcomitrium patens]XP_024376009.1 myosin-11-like [Physcomitrium patens]XP_024376010.1 myosin-11-like [Physcomitrium patens]XP_024376011.1 myosin-11-like [Physcomitrium patens]XP_024376013.1 myosin-11-like [Physcomitrium patens]PNR54425.1 hypothetical protein PHYPA_008102 [Physcomitrium patens]|eukprot:XP_024376006.1 myosin-11-like [Physcomitrella patens]